MLPLASQVVVLAFDVSLQPLLEDYGLPLAAMGILVVFLALVLVVLFITLLPRLMAGLHRLHPEQKEPASAAAKPAPSTDELPEELRVVIAAAVTAVMAEHRVVHIRGLTPEDLGWSLEGRMQHHTSHGIQRRDRR